MKNLKLNIELKSAKKQILFHIGSHKWLLTLGVAFSMQSALDNTKETLYKRYSRISRLERFYAKDFRRDLQNFMRKHFKWRDFTIFLWVLWYIFEHLFFKRPATGATFSKKQCSNFFKVNFKTKSYWSGPCFVSLTT